MASAASATATSDDSAPLVLDEVLQQMLHDDQEEWEYEYSTTETETYYLALELSYPEFKGSSAKVNVHPRGGYYKKWQDSTGGVDAAHRATAGAAAAGGDVQPKQEDEDSSNDEAAPASAAQDDDDDDDTLIDPALQSKGSLALQSKGKEPERARPNIDLKSTQAQPPERRPGTAPGDEAPQEEEREEIRDDVQILELHSDHPLIAYRGRLFEGEWAEIIGTEALLTRHDDKNPLPRLRPVPGDIDILGAVSSRIVTKEKIAKAKQKDHDPLAATRELWNINIPFGKDRRGERRQQARFLENLMALKKIKGQTDNVTVYALDGKGKDFDDTKDPDYKPRRKRAPAAGWATGAATPSEDGGGRGARGSRGRARGRARGRPRGGRPAVGMGAVRRGKQRATTVEPVSTPTPARWEDLDEEGEDGEAMDEDVEEGGDEDYDVSMGL